MVDDASVVEVTASGRWLLLSRVTWDNLAFMVVMCKVKKKPD